MPLHFEYHDDSIDLTVTLRRATLPDELRRYTLQQMATDKGYSSDNGEFYLHFVVYPDLIAAAPSGTLTVDGEAKPWPPSYADSLETLPRKGAIDPWLAKVYELNEDWKPAKAAKDEEQEKKD